MDSGSAPKDWPEPLAGYWIESAEVLTTVADEQDRPGHDSLGNPGRVNVVRHEGRLGVRLPRGRVVTRLEESGLRQVRTTAEETELAEPAREPPAVELDPFLLEKSVTVLVRGRDLPGRQREVIEAKLDALRRESADESRTQARRDAARRMLGELEEGLRSTLDVRAVVRRFRPAVNVRDPRPSIGTVLPLRVGSRVVYGVAPATPDPREQAEPAEPMVFHVVALGSREIVMLYAGGVHGMRHIRDADESRVHHAWFANRERVKTDATAPWIGRALLRDLAERGSGEIVVHRRRDGEPIAVERVGAGSTTLRVDGAPREVPVLHCRTACADELTVVNDPENPLVLRLHEAGAELLRTVDEVLAPLAPSR